jgi:hypothetical protein
MHFHGSRVRWVHPYLFARSQIGDKVLLNSGKHRPVAGWQHARELRHLAGWLIRNCDPSGIRSKQLSTFPDDESPEFLQPVVAPSPLLKFRSAAAITGPVILRRPTSNAVSSKATKIGEGSSYAGVFAPTMSAKIKPGVGETAYWLIALAALISLIVGIFFLAESGSTRTTHLYQVRLAAEGIPNQGAVTFDQAIQMLSVGH